MLENLYSFNRKIFILINAHPNADTFHVEAAIWLAEYLIIAFFLILSVYLAWKHRADKHIYLGVLFSTLIGIGISYLIRKEFHYPRPFVEKLGTHFFEHAPSPSFPSKHLTSMFSGILFLCWLPATRVFGIGWLLLALSVAWARIYLGIHWPLDMAGAFLVGLVASALTLSMQTEWVKKTVFRQA
ncbi:MAG: phosphatase PAP2 family protein [Neisseria sp.]|uniref:phosphatase PAP2 family protein n=1 Tax=Neisseria sp. TaxID=192066 RepID=UPI0026DA77E6|nr:phosphatase PAP2 family protein [Neisseria sp.]MDO4641224.1 phosphatase PAP2 family protein [Neisseria sp.]